MTSHYDFAVQFPSSLMTNDVEQILTSTDEHMDVFPLVI